MRYEEAMKYIVDIGKLGSSYGLERTYRLLEILGNPQNKIKVVHIAGTNGKGSTTSMVTSLLMGKGFKVGMYTSPYLEEFEERMQINRVNIPKERLGELMDKLKLAVDIVVEEGLSHPTEFEIITCLMFLYFYEEKVDYAVVEVGLGGRLDSTNVVTPIVSVITSISKDHTNLLGNTLGEIAGEKAGIIKEGIPVVIYPQKKEAFETIEKKAMEMHSDLKCIDINNCKVVGIENNTEHYQKVLVNLNNLELNIKLPLLGEHQVNNLLLALEVFYKISEVEGFSISKEEIEEAIYKVKWIGRLEVLKNTPLTVIDGAHNIEGITALAKNVDKYFKYNNIILLLGILADKDVEDMVKTIVPKAKKIYALTPHSERAELSEDLRKIVIKYNENCEAIEDYSVAYNKALEDAEENDMILASGSLYMIGEMRKIINKNN